MPPKVCIIILNWNGKKDTLECLSSVQKISYSNFETLVVDNGSTDDSASAIKEQFPSIKIIETGKNLGYAEGNNVGMRYGMDHGADFLFILNNDTVVESPILTHFIQAFEKEPDAGILGAKIYLYSERNRLDHLGGSWNRKKSAFDLIGYRKLDDEGAWNKMLPLDYVCGAGFMISRKLISAIGVLEARFFVYWEDTDYCFRARRAGFKVMSCPEAKLFHKVSSSFVGGKPHTSYFYSRNRLLWIERNLSTQEKLRLFFPTLLEFLNVYKLKTLKSAQLSLLKLFRPAADLKKKRELLLRYRATLQGGKDYLFRHFGDGPSWIYKR